MGITLKGHITMKNTSRNYNKIWDFLMLVFNLIMCTLCIITAIVVCFNPSDCFTTFLKLASLFLNFLLFTLFSFGYYIRVMNYGD